MLAGYGVVVVTLETSHCISTTERVWSRFKECLNALVLHILADVLLPFLQQYCPQVPFHRGWGGCF